MNPRRESKHEAYDVIVIGSGMGGLSAAACLAKAGKKVVVLERHDLPGGYAHHFRRNKYIFDAAVHLTSGCEEGGLIHTLLGILGIREMCDFVRVDPFYGVVFPGMRFSAPTGVEEFIEAHAREFPQEAKGLRKLIKTSEVLAEEVSRFPQDMNLWDVLQMPRRFPKLMKYHKATVGQVLDEYLRDARLKAVFPTLWPYVGLPPSRLSFLYWTMMLMSFLRGGAFYSKGSFQKLPNAFVQGIRGHGGEVLCGCSVRRIVVSKNKVEGVITDNGQRIRAPVVISNADARETFEELLGPENVPARYLKKIRRMKPSLSAFVVYMATDLDLKTYGAQHEMFFYRSWNHDETFQAIDHGRPSGLVATVPTLVDPSLAPKGEHIVVASTLIPYDVGVSWRKEKARYAEALMGELEALYPDLKGHITYAEGASPRTMERYTLNLTGAIYGWELSPEQVGRGRLDNATPIGGLYLSGHWAQPGGGIVAVIHSGVTTAQKVLGRPSLGDLLEALG
jgi:prolycopene isomerase